MANNRHLVDDFDIVRPSQLLNKGLPLPGLSGSYVVDEGWCAVITEGGAFKEILKPGTHFLNRYHFWRDVKAIAVDMRIQPLHISTAGEFTIAQPVPVKINLGLAVEYQVSDARRVALEVKTPLTNLYDRVIQAVRAAVAYATIDEIRTQGESLARTTLQRLQAMQLPKVTGVEVFNVLVTSISATDTGVDALAGQQLKEYNTARDWQLDQVMTQQSQVTWEWLLLHRPEVAQQMLATYGQVAREMIDKGLLDPAGFLNQPANSIGPINPAFFLENLGFPGGGLFGGQQPPPAMPTRPQTSISSQLTAGQSSTISDSHARMREEISYLQKLPGVTIETQPGVDEHRIPDGSYNLRVNLPRSSGGQITLYFACLPGYPRQPPAVDAEVDGQDTPFPSAILRRWTGQYLVEIVREAEQRFG
jgi:hypothetical protein